MKKKAHKSKRPGRPKKKRAYHRKANGSNWNGMPLEMSPLHSGPMMAVAKAALAKPQVIGVEDILEEMTKEQLRSLVLKFCS